jgi:hypothetical protein
VRITDDEQHIEFFAFGASTFIPLDTNLRTNYPEGNDTDRIITAVNFAANPHPQEVDGE